MPHNENGEFYWEPLQHTQYRAPKVPKKSRTNHSLLTYRMSDEARAGFALARAHGARRTATMIRVGKANLGQAIIHACHEIGTDKVVTALVAARNPEWNLCVLRYAPGITREQRSALATTLDKKSLDQARWALKNIIHLTDDEKKVLVELIGE